MMNIPAEMVAIAVRSGKIGALRSWIRMKIAGIAGYLRTPDALEACGVDKRTFRKHIDWLVSMDWVGEHNDVIYLRSWKKIVKHEKACMVSVSRDLTRTEAMLLIVSWLNRIQFSPYTKGAGSVIGRRGKRGKRAHQAPIAWGGIASRLIAGFIGRSKTTAIRIKKELESAGLLIQRQRLTSVDISLKDLRMARNHCPESVKGMVVFRGEVFLQLPNILHLAPVRFTWKKA